MLGGAVLDPVVLVRLSLSGAAIRLGQDVGFQFVQSRGVLLLAFWVIFQNAFMAATVLANSNQANALTIQESTRR